MINENAYMYSTVNSGDGHIASLGMHPMVYNAFDGTDQIAYANVGVQPIYTEINPQPVFANVGSQAYFANTGGASYVDADENYRQDMILMPNTQVVMPQCKILYNVPAVENYNAENWEESTEVQNSEGEISDIPADPGCCNVIDSDDCDDYDEDACVPDNVENNEVIDQNVVNQTEGCEYVVGYYPVYGVCNAVFVPPSYVVAPDGGVQDGRVMMDNDNCTNLFFINNYTQYSQSALVVQESNVVEESTTITYNNAEDGVFITQEVVEEEEEVVEEEEEEEEEEDNVGDNNVEMESVIPLVHPTNCNHSESNSESEICHEDNTIAKDENCDVGNVDETGYLPDTEETLRLKKPCVHLPESSSSSSSSSDEDDLGFSDAGSSDDCDGYNESDSSSDGGLLSSSDSEQSFSNRINMWEASRKYSHIRKRRKRPLRKAIDLKSAKVNRRRFHSMEEVLNQLLSEKCINQTLFHLLMAGLQEMKVDLLDEIYRIREKKTRDYSRELKAFALMLHFKQPSAFKRLAELFQYGWPPRYIILDWKRQLNQRRPRV